MNRYLPLQKAVARLLVDADFRHAFYSGRSDGELAPSDANILRKVDPRKLEIISEGYTGKRFERVASSFPLTLQLLDRHAPGHRRRYLAETPFTGNTLGERGTFAAYYRQASFLPPDVARLTRDLLTLEDALREPAASAAGYRLRPGFSRPLLAPGCRILPLEGPLDEVIVALPEVAAYPPAPALHVVVAEGGRPLVERLTPATRALLLACDGTRLLDELEARAPEAPEALARWFRRSVLTDAAAQAGGFPGPRSPPPPP